MTPLDRRQNHPLPSGDVPTTRLCQRAVRPPPLGEHANAPRCACAGNSSDDGAALRLPHSYDEYTSRGGRKTSWQMKTWPHRGHHSGRTAPTSPARALDGGVAPLFCVKIMTNKTFQRNRTRYSSPPCVDRQLRRKPALQATASSLSRLAYSCTHTRARLLPSLGSAPRDGTFFALLRTLSLFEQLCPSSRASVLPLLLPIVR
mmetsp:Transcript_18951/g.58837  ORF Transcript_18951/g.58837 Transcript_18951/m.58837 type:complete len:203 (-) Transcript_18951:326-934(-)